MTGYRPPPTQHRELLNLAGAAERRELLNLAGAAERRELLDHACKQTHAPSVAPYSQIDLNKHQRLRA